MRVKRFVAPTLTEAVRLVRAEFGDDAMILRTGKARQPGLLGFIRPAWVAVTAGLDGEGAGPAAPGPRNAGGSAGAQAIRVARVEASSSSPQVEVETTPVADRGVAAVPPAEAGLPQLKLTDLAVAHLVERLRQQEVAEEHIPHLSAELRRRVAQGGEAPQQHLVRLLAERLTVTGPWVLGGTPLIVPLVGPTGVGKTTTIAKLAATHALLGGRRVGLITADTYRVAAVEQLRTYAEILNVPLEVIYDPKEVPGALERLQDRELVLVDTAGRSPLSEEHLQELQLFLIAMGQHQAQLVLSATTRHTDMVRIVDAFLAHVRVEGLIITKLDETRAYGCLYNAVCRAKKPLSFVTNGQGVPEDIEAADSLRLGSVIVGVEAW
jgi:flagellar biosynthesis protein FlhF